MAWVGFPRTKACDLARLVVVVVCGCACAPAAADWNQWRGPNRNGVAPESPPLASAWPKEGPPKLWQSEPIPGGYTKGGLSSLAVADGRVYLYVNWISHVPLATRTLDAEGLGKLGWFPEKPPEDTVKAVEVARVSEERTKLIRRDLAEWTRQWVEKSLDEGNRKKFGRFASDRLNRGANAIPLEALDKLATIKDKPFENQEALDKWLAEGKFENSVRALVLDAIPTERQVVHDVIVCLDAKDGKKAWRVEYAPLGMGGYSTPCVADGRCYVAGGGMAYCLDAKTGREIWKQKITGAIGGDPNAQKNSSFAVADGMAFLPVGPLACFDAATGEVLWKQAKVPLAHGSPALWRKDGKTFVICNTGKDAVCVDAKTGEIAWEVPGGGCSTAAIVDDTMAIVSDRKEVGVTAYKLSPTKPEKLWTVETFTDRGSSPIVYADHVYAIGNAGGVCVELKSGKVLWRDAKLGTGEISSPILADGKILAFTHSANWPTGAVLMLEANPPNVNVLAKGGMAGMLWCTSPAFVDGKVFLRGEEGVACYDLTKRPEPPK